MPSTVRDTFASVGLQPAGPAGWGQSVSERAPGVYVVALASDADVMAPTTLSAPLDIAAVAKLLDARPQLRLDDDADEPTVGDVAARLGGFWLPDEVVLYIGLAGQPLGRRVRQYYRTPLGARRPHAGGWWLKTLAVLDDVSVYWAATPDYTTAEEEMLRAFATGVSPRARTALHDRDRVMPFANLRGHDNLIKRHRIRGATGDLPREVATNG